MASRPAPVNSLRDYTGIAPWKATIGRPFDGSRLVAAGFVNVHERGIYRTVVGT